MKLIPLLERTKSCTKCGAFVSVKYLHENGKPYCNKCIINVKLKFVIKMDKENVIRRFCKLSTRVGEHLNHKFAHDCFCDKNSVGTDDIKFFQFEEEIINFIEKSVEQNIQQLQSLIKSRV